MKSLQPTELIAMADEPMENLALFKLTDQETAQVIKEAGGGTVTWLRRDGHPTGAYVQIVVMDGQIYTTSTNDRGKNKAWRRDPRTAWIFDVPDRGGVTAIGRVVFEEDPALKMVVYNAHADAAQLTGEKRDKFYRSYQYARPRGDAPFSREICDIGYW
jgi:hypothetical protein